ncbi:MAG TPA: acetolactate synthase large subunit [Alphaproteobacteria bacterium]|nr:acetolactate synthase large subunit [Alphaproteobacteria bacterium]
MNGAEALVRTLAAADVTVCFANPGTSEMQLVAAIGADDGMRSVLGLFEGVVTGAADGYFRIKGKPAATLLHLGPGLANGLSNLHNAKRARSAILNIIGDHALYHRALDAPLTSDIETVAKPFSKWVRMAESIDTVSGDALAALRAAVSGVPGPVSLIIPADIAWTEGAKPATPQALPERAKPDAARVTAIAKALSAAGSKGMLLLGGFSATKKGLAAAGRIRAKTGARLVGDFFLNKAAFGAGTVQLPRMPYFGEQAIEVLKGLETLVLVESKAPVSFFAYPGKPSVLTDPATAVRHLAHPEEDGEAALEALADELGAPREPADVLGANLPAAPDAGALSADSAAKIISRALPDGAIVVNEAITSGFFLMLYLGGAAPHDIFDQMGGSLGYGLPAAVGAAIAAPDRKVVCPVGDGSAMYTVQALWTMAREKLDVLSIVFANRSYGILNFEMSRVGAQNPGPKALSMLAIDNPELGFTHLAQGMGVEAARATTVGEFQNLVTRAMRMRGPFLIEAVI